METHIVDVASFKPLRNLAKASVSACHVDAGLSLAMAPPRRIFEFGLLGIPNAIDAFRDVVKSVTSPTAIAIIPSLTRIKAQSGIGGPSLCDCTVGRVDVDNRMFRLLHDCVPTL